MPGGVAGKRIRPEFRNGNLADIVFLDPPYADAAAYDDTLATLARSHSALLMDGAVVIAEHARKQPPKERYDLLVRTRLLEQGDAALSFYAVSPETGQPVD